MPKKDAVLKPNIINPKLAIALYANKRFILV